MRTPDPRRLDGRRAIVTGGGGGIGRATARILARCGATVAVCDRRGPVAAPNAPPEPDAADPALYRVLDVRDAEAVRGFVDDVTATLGGVDILVNNAGGTFAATVLETTEKGEDRLIAENFTQVTRFVRLVVPLMAPGSSIITVTSVEAHQAAPGFAVYGAMKAALESLTKSLALELAGRHIRVNAIAPDALVSPGENDTRRQYLELDADFEPVHEPPLGFFGDPEDAGWAVAFLASEAARFITGTTLHVDGGSHAAGGWRRRV